MSYFFEIDPTSMWDRALKRKDMQVPAKCTQVRLILNAVDVPFAASGVWACGHGLSWGKLQEVCPRLWILVKVFHFIYNCLK